VETWLRAVLRLIDMVIDNENTNLSVRSYILFVL
jgi:hypothetical protein